MAVKKKGLGKGLDSLIPEKSNKPLTKVPAEEYTEQEIVEIGLIENIQRENLNPIE